MAEQQTSGGDVILPPRKPTALYNAALFGAASGGISITVYVIYNIFICGCG